MGHENLWREKHVRGWNRGGERDGLNVYMSLCDEFFLDVVAEGMRMTIPKKMKIKVPFLCRRVASCQGQGDIQYHTEYAARKCTRHMSVVYDSIKEG